MKKKIIIISSIIVFVILLLLPIYGEKLACQETASRWKPECYNKKLNAFEYLIKYYNENKVNEQQIQSEQTSIITSAELQQGWYYSTKDQKKLDTPSTWIHTGDNTKSSRWYDPNKVKK